MYMNTFRYCKLACICIEIIIHEQFDDDCPISVVSFNENVVWIKKEVWKRYLTKYYLPFVIQVCKRSQKSINKYKFYCSPLDCNLQNANFNKSRIREVHQSLLQLISEYSISLDKTDHFNQSKLCEKALSNVFVDDMTNKKYQRLQNAENSEYISSSEDDDDDNNDMKLIAQGIADGKIELFARSLKTVDISRGSSDDCPISIGDWIWCFKRLLSNMKIVWHVVVKIIQVSYINADFVMLNDYMQRNVCILIVFLTC